MADTRSIELTRDEALVLYDLLQREIDLANGARLAVATEHQAELWALNGLNCLLEKVVYEAFSPDYPARLAAAREALVEACDPWPSDIASRNDG